MSTADKILSLTSDFAHYISDSGNFIASKLTTLLGVASVGTGAAMGVANDTISKLTDGAAVWTLQDYAAVVALVGGITLIIKNAVDIYYKIRSKGKL